MSQSQKPVTAAAATVAYPDTFPAEAALYIVNILRRKEELVAKKLAKSVWVLQGYLQGAVVGEPSSTGSEGPGFVLPFSVEEVSPLSMASAEEVAASIECLQAESEGREFSAAGIGGLIGLLPKKAILEWLLRMAIDFLDGKLGGLASDS
jgi:hypothetical protein